MTDIEKQNIKVTIHEILQDYSWWLFNHNYCDSDICMEEPLAADEYFNEIKDKINYETTKR